MYLRGSYIICMCSIMKMIQSFIFILVFLNLSEIAFCQNGNAEFVVDDQELFYVDQDLTWNEASSLCRSFQSSLLTVSGPLFALHVLESLATFHAQHLLWIGGRLIHDQWMWKISGLPINLQGENVLFPVITRSNKSNLIHRQCLAIDPKNVLFPTFVSLNCSETRGLLCEKAQQQPTLLVEEFNYKHHNYTIYEGQSSWQTAVAICNKHNSYLTALSGETELQEVALTLASYTHLDISLVWIGALSDYKYWQWISTGDEVEYVVENYTVGLKCLALDTKTQIFFAKNCSDGHAFVCESKHPNDDFWESFVHHSAEYTIHSLKTTWEKADKICQMDNSHLATVPDLSTANKIAVNMGHSWESLKTAWLGARTSSVGYKPVMKWQEYNVELSLIKNKNGYPPWQNETIRLKENVCLMIGMTISHDYYFSISACDDARGFVCERDASMPIPITFNFRVGDKDLIFHDKPETWFKAQEICKLEYSRLLIISDPDDLSSVKQFTTRHKLWLDGIFNSDKWQWNHEVSELPPQSNPYGLPRIYKKSQNSPNKCLSIYLKKLHPKFIISPCKTKLSFICERNSQKEQVIKYKESEYTVINKHLSWYEASAVCQARDQNLAITCDINEAEFLSNLTIAYGDLWLGGIQRKEKWIWDAPDKTLSHKTDPKIGYPPWLYGKSNRTGTSCLTLTKNELSHAAFLDTACNEIKSFICEKYSIQAHKHIFLQPRIAVLEDRQYMFYPQSSSWKDANEECSDNLAFLAIVSTSKIARFIANLTYGYPEIWIGGTLEGSVWKWFVNGEKIGTWGENETQWASENEIFDEELPLRNQFLALNRLNPNIPLFEEKSGDEKLGFVCERVNNAEEDEYLVEKVPFENGELAFFENKLNYTEAYEMCEANNGILVTADTPEIMKIIKDYSKKFHGLWLGATFTSNTRKFLWTHIRKEVAGKIEIITDSQVLVHQREKRSGEDFRDEIFDKSELEENIKDEYDQGSDTYEEVESDNNNIFESWEVPPKKRTFPNDRDYFDIKQSNRSKRSAGIGGLKSFSFHDSSGEYDDEEVVLSDYYDEKYESSAMHTVDDISLSYSTTTDIYEKWDKSIETKELPTTKKTYDVTAADMEISTIPKVYIALEVPEASTARKTLKESTESGRLSTTRSVYAASKELQTITDRNYGQKSTEMQTFSKVERVHIAKQSPQTSTEMKNTTEMSTTGRLSTVSVQVQNLSSKMNQPVLSTTPKTSRFYPTKSTPEDTTTVEKDFTDSLKNKSTLWSEIKRPRTIGSTLTTEQNIDLGTNQTQTVPETQKTTVNNTVLTLYTTTYTTKTPTQSVEELTEKVIDPLLAHLIYCLKINEQGKLVALNCSLKQSFVCEIRSKTQINKVQGYTQDNIDYIVSNEKLTWAKAYKKCNKTFDGYLAIFNNIDEMNFLNNISIDFQDLWIGAKYFNNWKWPYINKRLHYNKSLWATPRRLYSCANIYRKHSSQLLLIDRNCTEKHGYICKNVKSESVYVETINGYVFHWKPVNFFEALRICSENNTILVAGYDKDEVWSIISLHKGLHTFWISALHVKNDWLWLYQNEKIKAGNRSHFHHTSGRECVSAFKNSNTSYLIIDQDCDTYLPFVCKNANNHSIVYNNMSYTFYVIKKNWTEAYDYCASAGQHLAIVKDAESAKIVQNFALMFNDLWVGGKWENIKRWVWYYSGEIMYKDPLLHRNIRKPTLQTLLTAEDICLYAHSFITEPSLISCTDCSERKGFICQGESVNNVPSIQSITKNGRVYTLYSRLLTWIEAQEVCTVNGTYLVVVDTEEEMEVLKDFNLNTFWVGGKSDGNNSWLWDHTGADVDTRLLPLPKIKFQRNIRNCISFYKFGNDTKLVNLNCDLRLSFVCEESGHNYKPQTRRLDFENEYLVLHSLQLPWNEANDMCDSAGQHLASIVNENVKHFLDLPSEYHDLWLDGKNEDDIWTWTELDIEVDTSFDISRNDTKNLLRPFLRSNPRPGHDCLSLYRPNANIFNFLDQLCKHRFGFVCQGTKYMHFHIKTVILSGRVYSIYTKKASWHQANNICKSNGTYLAVLSTIAEMELLSNSDLNFVKVWTGAIYKQNKWIWDHIDTEIEVNNYTKYLNSNGGCGLFRKSHQGGVSMLPKNCSDLYAFVCEERGDQGKWTTKPLNISGHYYSVSSERAVWSHAFDMCTENGQYLALIDTDIEMEVINQLDIDFHDLWVGARKSQNSNSWTWIHTGREFLLDKAVHKLINNGTENHCLNIYREWNSSSLFIDRDCNEQHGYICESVPIYKQYPLVLHTTFKGHKYLLIQQQLTWVQAYHACDRFNGYLAIIGNQAEADFLSSINKAFHDLWTGGSKLNDSIWRWYYTRQTITEDVNWERLPTRNNHKCLNLYTADGNTGIFMDRQCVERHSFICEETDQYEIISENNYPKDIDSLESEVLHGSLYPKEILPYVVSYKGRKYMFFSVRIDFDTAKEECKRNSGYLLIFEDDEEMEFIGNNTGDYHNFWIDGKYRNNTWEWEHLAITIPTDKFLNSYPRQNYDCLTFYRHDNVTSYFVDRKCEEKHSFVCKDIIEVRSTAMYVQEDITYRNRYYLVLADNQVTWSEAKKFCEEESGYLAIADDLGEAFFLASLGNDFWIDAQFDELRNTWLWNHLHEEIIFENYNLTVYHPILETHFKSRCLNIFRSLNNTPSFVERDCNDRFGFICEDLVPLPDNAANITREYNGRKYLFVQNKTTWENAYKTCRANRSYLAVVTTHEERMFISEITNNLRDLWIDGIYMTTSWMSNYTGQNLELASAVNEDNLDPNTDLTEWNGMDRRPGYNCLSAYLPFFNVYRFVGRKCSEEHSFVCEEMVEVPTTLQNIEYNGVHYTISMEPLTWEEAYIKCSKHGYLAIIDSLEEATALAELSGRYHSLWIGAIYNKEEWSWNYTGEIIEAEEGIWGYIIPRNDFNCSILYRDDYSNAIIVGKACSDRFGYICEEGETPTIDHRQETVFKYDGKIYTLYHQQLSWDNAKQYCEDKRSALAIMESMELAKLLASEKEYYDIWTDGISDGLLWVWSTNGIHLPRYDQSVIKYMRIMPRTDRSCLTLFRSNNAPHYLDNDCNLNRTFVCQKYDTVLAGNITTVRRNKTSYYIINSLKTWFEAWDICAANGSYLPIVKDADTADFVSSLYPYAIGEIWLGARKLNNWWSWELTDELLVEIQTEVEFPVWSRLNQPDNMCLGLDHKTTMYPVFTDVNCSSLKAVICEQGCPILPPVNGSWSREACTGRVQQIGEKCNIKCDNGYLSYGFPNITCTEDGWSHEVPVCLNVEDFAMNIILNIKNAFNKYYQKQNLALLFLVDSSSSVGWENYKSVLEIVKSISVGVSASQNNIKQGLLTFEAETKVEISLNLIETCSFIQRVDKLTYRSISDVVSFRKSFETARRVLREARSTHSTVIVIFTSNNSTEHIDNDLFNLKQNGNTIMVIGIKPQVNIDLIQKLASPCTTKYQINIDYASLDEIAYVLNRTFLYSGELPCCMRLKSTNGLNISPTSCTRDVSQKNARCSISCDGLYQLQGMDSLLCTSDGWQSTLEIKRPFPECYTTTQVTQALLITLKDLYESNIVDSTLFLIDQSGSMLEDDFYSEVKFVKQLLQIENTNLGVIIFNSNAYVVIPLDRYTNSDALCSLYDRMDSLRFSGGSTNYEKAFLVSLQQINNYRIQHHDNLPREQRTLIIMLTDGQNSETIESANLLKEEGHIIMVITIGVNKRRNLINMVSNAPNNWPLLFSLNTFQDLEKMNTYISNKLRNRTIVCCKIPVEFQKSQSRMYIIQKEQLDVNCSPGYSLSVENSTLKCTGVGLNVVPTCFAVPKRIAEYVTAQINRIFNKNYYLQPSVFKGQKQIIVFLIDQTDTMTPTKNNQALTFVKSLANAFLSSENRAVGLINGQNHEAVMSIEPNVTSITEFVRLLKNITVTSTSYSLYKPLKYILEKLVDTNVGNVLTVIVSDRVYISTPSLKLAKKILSSNSNLYVMEVHNDTTDSNIYRLVESSHDFFVSGYYMIKDSLYTIDSFETLEAVAENIYLI